ncbi:MAG TPA: SIS domain-containing protein [Terracidiphilus sp.]|jgi:glucosamine--fructose-6-phosphate aminotransferase (isomerizing)|nr:SIS domain-containing protein [Terracidiphilus sp.]
MESGAATLHEIHSQPEVWGRCLSTLDRLDLEPLVGDKDPRIHEWLFVGCGTSYYLAQAAAATLTTLAGVPARALPASEILLFPGLFFPIKEAGLFPVLISRSGHTSEVLQVAEFLRQRGVEFLAVTCDGNELTRLSTRILKLPVTEASTVMTSSFTSMLMALQYIAARLAGQDEFVDALHSLPAALAGLLPMYGRKIEKFAQRSFEDVAFLGQGALYPIASETALKIMESSSSYAQFFHTLEFRHGPMSIVSEKVLVGALLSETGYAEESAVLLEMKALGGCTLAIANRLSPEVRNSADLAIELGLAVPELARLAVYVVWGQLLGCRLGLRKGLDPDSPRHLSRVVTLVD